MIAGREGQSAKSQLLEKSPGFARTKLSGGGGEG